MKINWSFLDTFNSTAFKGWSGGWLWVYTGGIWGACAIITAITGQELPEAWLGTWLVGLAGYSGIGAMQYKTMRTSDYGALERQAKIEAAKSPSVSSTTVQTGASPVNVEGGG